LDANKKKKKKLEPFGNIRKALEIGLIVACQMAVDRCQHWDLSCELRVKVGGIGWSTDLGEERWRDLLVQNVLPIHALEEGMTLDLLCIRLAASKALLRITRQQLL